MKTFHCDFCGHPIFFENFQCLQCGSALAFLPDRLSLCAIEPERDFTGNWILMEARSDWRRLAAEPEPFLTVQQDEP